MVCYGQDEMPPQTIQLSQYGKDRTDLKVWVPNPAHTLVGIQNVPQSAHDGSWPSMPDKFNLRVTIMCALM